MSESHRLGRRHLVNNVMLTTTGVFTVLIASVLLFILGYLFINGARNLDLGFFTQLPKPTGETGGGMANAIVGSAKVLAMATMIGVPVGFLGGVYLAEYGNKSFAFIVRYVTDLLNGVPSIVIGIFAYTLIILRTKHFSAVAGGLALGLMMVPIAVRSTVEFLGKVRNGLREGALGLGTAKWR
ncbi:MAG: PstA family ABC transporter permease, partial [Burkholderiales bacterium]